jgi:hypothetical protein
MLGRQRTGQGLLPKPPLLNSESADEFELLHAALENEIRPEGIIEHMYVADISSLLWEILRHRRCKAVIINAGFRAALEQLLMQLLRAPGQLDYTVKDEADELAFRWFTEEGAKKKVAEILNQFGLDESSIEAEAIRRSSQDLELLDRMLTSLESRRNRALGCIAEYRDALSRRLRESADRIIEANGVPRLEAAARKRSSAA